MEIVVVVGIACALPVLLWCLMFFVTVVGDVPVRFLASSIKAGLRVRQWIGAKGDE